MGKASRGAIHPSQALGVVCGWGDMIADNVALRDIEVLGSSAT